MTTPITSLAQCQALDQQDPLRGLRDLFDLPPGVIYLDGNSLGVMPKATPARVADCVTREWGTDLIQSWNKAGWFNRPQSVGDKIARLIGASAGQVVATDSTSINLFKVLSAALNIAGHRVALVPKDGYDSEALLACRETVSVRMQACSPPPRHIFSCFRSSQ